MEIEAKTSLTEFPIDIEPVEDAKPKNNWKLIALVSGSSVLAVVLALLMLWSSGGDQKTPQTGGTSVPNPVPEPLQDDDTGIKYKFPSAPPPSPFDADDVNEMEMPSLSASASGIPMEEKAGSEAETDDDSEDDDNNDRESIDGIFVDGNDFPIDADSKDLYFDVDAEDDPICEAGKPLRLLSDPSLTASLDRITVGVFDKHLSEDFILNLSSSVPLSALRSLITSALQSTEAVKLYTRGSMELTDDSMLMGAVYEAYKDVKGNLYLRVHPESEEVESKDIEVESESGAVDAEEGESVNDFGQHLQDSSTSTITISYPISEDFKYHQSYSLDDRMAEVQNVLSELPDAIPVVAQVFNHPELDGYTGVLSPELPVATAKLLLLPKFNASEQGFVLRIFVDGVECADDLEIGKLAEEHRNEDGNVYLACTIERLDSSPTKLMYSFFQRQSFSEHVRKQLPEATPVIIEADNGLLFYWAADPGSTVHELKQEFKVKHGLSPFVLIHLYLSNAVLEDDEALVSDIHREHAELDGNVYLTCTIFDPLPFSYKHNFSFDERHERAQQILSQHPTDILVVFEFFYPHSPSPFFYNLPFDLTIADFKDHLNERFSISSLSPMRLTGYQGVELDDSLTLGFVYAQCKDEDGFLYLSVFGISGVDVEAEEKAVEEAVEANEKAVEEPVSVVPIVPQTITTYTFPHDAHPSIFTYFQEESTAARTANATQELQRYPDSVLLCLEVFNYLPQRTYYLQSRKRSLQVSKLKLELSDTLNLPNASVLDAYVGGEVVGDDEVIGELWDRCKEEDGNLYLAFTVEVGKSLEGISGVTINYQKDTFTFPFDTKTTVATLITHLRFILNAPIDHNLHLSINGTELIDSSVRIADVVKEHSSTVIDCTIKPIFENAFIGSFKKSVPLDARKNYFAQAMQEHPDSIAIVLELDPTGLPLPTFPAPLRFLAFKSETFGRMSERIASLLLPSELDMRAELQVYGFPVDGDALLGPVHEYYASKEDGGLYLGLLLQKN